MLEGAIAYLIAAAFVFGTVAIVWSGYFLMRFFWAKADEEDTHELAGSVIFRVAALHGLILALVFAQNLFGYQEIRSSLVREATAVADIYYDFGRYGEDNSATIQGAIKEYVQLVINDEWQLLAEERRLSWKAWEQREIIYNAILDLEPKSLRQTTIRDHMVSQIQRIAELRQARENNALNTLNILFWIPAIAGLFFVAIPYFVFSPTRLNMTLLTVYAGFSGIVLFVIYAFSDPFSTPNRLEPVAFERLLENLDATN